MSSLILIIEDDVAFRSVIVESLQGAELEVIEAGTAEEGKALLKKHDVDVAIVDLGLPDGSGLQVIEALLKDPELQDKKTKAFILTNMDNLNTMAEAAELGMVDYLMKQDVSLDQIVAHAKKLLAH